MTRVTLAGIADNIVNNSTLQTNLDWNLKNSVNQFLQGMIRVGEIDSLSIYSGDCKLLALAYSEASMSRDCPATIRSKNFFDKFYWSSKEGVPSLGIVSKIRVPKNTGSFYLVAKVAITNQWLESFSEVKNGFSALDIRVDQFEDSGTLVMREGLTASNEWVASLISDDIILYLLNELGFSFGEKINRFSLILLFSDLALIAALFWLVTNRERDFNYEKRQFISWCEDLGSKDSGDGNSGGGFRDSPERYNLNTAKETISTAVQRSCDLVKKYDEEKEGLNQEIEKYRQDLFELQLEIAEAKKYESLSDQIKRSLNTFLADSKELVHEVETISEMLGLHIVKQSHYLNKLMLNWQQGLSEQSPRKFFRSLSERMISENHSQLDEELKNVEVVTRELSSSGLFLSLESQKIFLRVKNIHELVSYWQSIFQIENDQTTSNLLLLPIIVQGQNLVQVASSSSIRCHFNNTIGENISLDQLEVPASTWISIFYHLNLALVMMGQAHGMKDIEIQTCLKNRKNQTLLIISVISNRRERSLLNLPKLPDSAFYHVKIVAKMIAPYSIYLTQLPTHNNFPTIAISWNESKLLDTGVKTSSESFAVT